MVGLGWGLAQGSIGKMDQVPPEGKSLQPPKQGAGAAGAVVWGVWEKGRERAHAVPQWKSS